MEDSTLRAGLDGASQFVWSRELAGKLVKPASSGDLYLIGLGEALETENFREPQVTLGLSKCEKN